MTYWVLTVVALAALLAGIGDLTKDQDQFRDSDLLQLQDGSCQTSSVVAPNVIQLNA